MKFISYIYQGKPDYGILNQNSQIVPLAIILSSLNYDVPPDLLAFIIEYGRTINLEINSVLYHFADQAISLTEVKLLSPIRYPRRNVFCVGKNYQDHALEVTEFTNEGSIQLPTYPIYFSKACDVLLGDQEIIEIRQPSARKLDYEVELAVIIAKDGKDIDLNATEQYIFGYAVSNDISARDLQTARGQWFKGKSLDNSLALGPYLVSAEEIAFPPQLNISAKVNGELRQKSNTANFIFDLATLISDLSQGMTLRAGDIIMTGTPAGVGVAMKPPQYLKSGDLIEFEIENIGKLTNSVKIVD